MNWYKTSSTVYPQNTDTNSSKVYNYVRRNIVEIEKEDETTGNIVIMYEYEELRILKENWSIYVSTEINTANIDFIAMMTDVELPEEG